MVSSSDNARMYHPVFAHSLQSLRDHRVCLKTLFKVLLGDSVISTDRRARAQSPFTLIVHPLPLACLQMRLQQIP